MSSPTLNTALAAPDLAALKKEELDGLASKLRYAIKLRETETEAPDGYYTFTAGLSTLLMGLFERHTKKLGEQERSNPNGEAAPQESGNKPWMDDLLGELLAISREETTRAMQVISQKDEELRSVMEELKKVKLEALLTIGELSDACNEGYELLEKVSNELCPPPAEEICEVCQEVNSYLISYDEPSEFSLKIETAVDTITAIGSRYHCE